MRLKSHAAWALGALALALVGLGAPPPASAANPPRIIAAWVSEVTATSANLNLQVNPEGQSTTYRFEYLSEAAFQANLAAGHEGFAGAAKAPPSGSGVAGSGAANVTLVQQLKGLAPLTTYRYRALATSSAGTVTGAPHSLGTQAPSNVFVPLDDRGWELVSPAEKAGGAVAAPESLFGGGAFQAALNGESVTYSAAASFAGGAGAPGASQYVSRRGGSGWSTENITAPALSGSYGDHPDGSPYRLFSEDLAHGLLLNGERCRGESGACPVANPPLPGSGAPPGYQNYYLRGEEEGSFSSLLSGSDLTHTSLSAAEFGLELVGTTPQLSRVVLSSCAALAGGAVEVPGAAGCDPAAANLYLWGGGGLELINLPPGGSASLPGAKLAAPSGAVSDDGARVYWVDDSGHLYLEEAGAAKTVDESGEAEFQLASANGSVAYYLADAHLQRYVAASESTTDLTPGGGVQGVLGAAADGSIVYYATAEGIFRWQGGSASPVAEGAGAAAPADYPPAEGAARVSADGSHLLFLSKAELSGYENFELPELFLYGPPPGGGGSALLCVSCNPTGERPRGGASIPAAVANGSTRIYKPRVLSADGERVFFDSEDVLSIQDTNQRPDVYEWEAAGAGSCTHAPGCVQLVSSGRSGEASTFLDASAEGTDVFFLTGESLVAGDPGSIDLYDYREGGGFPAAPTAIPCSADACQPLPSAPEDPTPGTLTANAGNPPLRFPAKKGKKKHHRHKPSHRKGHHRHRGPHQSHAGGRNRGVAG